MMYAACYRIRSAGDTLFRASVSTANREDAEHDLAFYREVDPSNEYVLGQQPTPEWVVAE